MTWFEWLTLMWMRNLRSIDRWLVRMLLDCFIVRKISSSCQTWFTGFPFGFALFACRRVLLAIVLTFSISSAANQTRKVASTPAFAIFPLIIRILWLLEFHVSFLCGLHIDGISKAIFRRFLINSKYYFRVKLKDDMNFEYIHRLLKRVERLECRSESTLIRTTRNWILLAEFKRARLGDNGA